MFEKVCKTWCGKAMFKEGKDEMEFHVFSMFQNVGSTK